MSKVIISSAGYAGQDTSYNKALTLFVVNDQLV
jgi:hypothetical protein